MNAHSPLSIYIHIPFCETRCTYCAFNVYTDLHDLIPAYVNAVCDELRIVASQNASALVHTVYIGGGTPSLLKPGFFQQILERLRSDFNFVRDVEVTMESNPNDLATPYLGELRALGINRLSIGMQSATPKILRLFDRRHDLDAVRASVAAAREAGFANVNLDIIFGSPGESFVEWEETVGSLLCFAPEHVSMYGLELKGGTQLRLQVDAGAVPSPDDDLFADMYEYASKRLASAGYQQYEISNWSLPNLECRHNLQYWRNLPYLGIGAGAHGFAGGYRYSNIASPIKYIGALKGISQWGVEFPLTPAVSKSIRVDTQDDLYETVMMGMRLTEEGMNRAIFESRFGTDIVEMFPEELAKLESLGLLTVESDRVRISQKGRLLSNAVIRELV